jgi:hypothetical protein
MQGSKIFKAMSSDPQMSWLFPSPRDPPPVDLFGVALFLVYLRARGYFGGRGKKIMV